MSNFTSSTPSFDAMLASAGQYGVMRRCIGGVFSSVSTTAATATSGGVSIKRWTDPIPVPSVGTGVKGYTMNMSDIISGATNIVLYSCLEYVLGTLTLNGNVASNLGSMPTKTQLGTSMQTGSKHLICFVTTAGTAVTPTITVTYTNQDGTTNQSASITLPTTPLVNSAFLVPLANGDSGVQAITGLSSSVTTGTMVLNFYGLLELSTANSAGTAGTAGNVETIITPTYPKFVCEPNENVNIYAFGTTSGTALSADFVFTPETT